MLATLAAAENIDPDNDGSQYAHTENVGWCNAEPSGNGGPGVQVGDDELSGWMWGENIGWVSLSCKNTLSCATKNYGVTNNGSGTLSGYGWGENVGWLSFSCANTSSCGTASYGVTIDDMTGVFSGYAWGENIGWVSFNCANTGTCGIVDYKVKSGWICDPAPGAPLGSPALLLGESGGDTLLSWGSITGETGYDIVQGNLNDLRNNGGDFGLATDQCLDNNRTTESLLFSGTPPAGQGSWFLVRGANCGGGGSYDTLPPNPPLVPRGPGITGSGNDCP